jgi:hypothetical protein
MNTILADARILGTIGGFAVESAMHEVDLCDGSIQVLRFVRDPRDPAPRSRFLRALRMHNGMHAVFDLRRLSRTLAGDMTTFTERDRPGLIKFTLRPLYGTEEQFHLAVQANWISVGLFDQQLEASEQAAAA